MARIAGIDLPRGKQIETALTYIYGVGRSSARRTCLETGVAPETKVSDLTDEEIVRLRQFIEQNFRIEGDLKRERDQNIKRLMEIGCYRGLRHRKGLPVRGQRTHTNARTRKGPRPQVGIKKKQRQITR
ncbi:MAG: 30S ribosomal protein S13 [Actinomycetota bacterium]|nr:30S ribosomal protein S13 [Actinomycetota bacterium]